jgi:endonuclease/exonuclease/phosphatase family metal-dependent hydrolase
MGFKGSKYTWTNRQSDGTFTKERLDRAMANKEWRSMFKEVVVHVLAGRTSDHKPLLIECTEKGEEKVRGKRGFKFEAKWMLDEE